ncbi:conserved Plasmodium protein, unknown function [Plasmodium gallinaceum]|uniref:Uncharacterized protein n=1 Tax=Plasmodium gallinaceum TaxID=5849 RepID=A0A1J1GMV7_PLAGA|nr:conserved Plasmodium protein, unknown function [Plasmodium gallinaceum]CRG93784.1 conserved Plasmodium protein, unknown function [Plasmodium gallinaceum]
MKSRTFDNLFASFLNISSSSGDSIDSSSEKCSSEISVSSLSTENLFDNENINPSKTNSQRKSSIAYDEEKETSNSDLEYEITSKYVKSILKNKEKKKFYEFKKYLSDTDVFSTFVQIFLHLIKNKEEIKNPYDYIINFFKLKNNDYDNEKKKVLIEENKFYKKENEELNNKINLLEVEIYDIQKKNCCNTIVKIFFKDDDEQFNASDIFNKIIKNNKKFKIEPSFIFTKDIFFLFLNFLNDATRTKLHDILIQKTCEQNHSFFYDKLLKKLMKFINYYLSFDKSSINEHL